MRRLEVQVEMPVEIETAWKIRQLVPDSCFVAGGTLLQAEWEEAVMPAVLISLESIPSLRGIALSTGAHPCLKIGALTTLAECLRHPLLVRHGKLLAEACGRIAAPAVRNRATLGGNIASGTGDAIPALLALDGELTWFEGESPVSAPLWQWLLARKEGSRKGDALIAEVRLPLNPEGARRIAFFRKVGRREAFTPALVTVAAACRVNETTGRIEQVRLAAGGGKHFPQRLPESERLLQGSCPDAGLWAELHAKIIEEFESYSDGLVSETYRKTVAANLIVANLSSSLAEMRERRDEGWN